MEEMKFNKLKRPRCEHCGRSLYTLKPTGVPPDHCPNCGEIVSSEKKKQIHNYEGLVIMIFCPIFAIIFLSVMLVLIILSL